MKWYEIMVKGKNDTRRKLYKRFSSYNYTIEEVNKEITKLKKCNEHLIISLRIR